jgi:Carboxylesterase family
VKRTGHVAQKEGSLNLGQKDILTALEWLQLNIAAFGGDKHKVGLSLYYARRVLTTSLTEDHGIWHKLGGHRYQRSVLCQRHREADQGRCTFLLRVQRKQ